MEMRRSVITALLLSSLGAAQACAEAVQDEVIQSENASQFKFLMVGGLTFGGDELAKIEFSDGDDAKIKAGQLLHVAVGVQFEPGELPMSVAATLGYHFDISYAENGDTTFSRVPVELMGFYHLDMHRFGLGLTYHMSPELDVDYDFGKGGADFDNAVGAVLEYNYMMSDSVGLGVRYVNIEYDLSNSFYGQEESFSGSHIGLMARLML